MLRWCALAVHLLLGASAARLRSWNSTGALVNSTNATEAKANSTKWPWNQEKATHTPVTKLEKRFTDPKDPMCFANTGFKCDGKTTACEPWVACSEDHFCTCHKWGCADAAGACRPAKSRWLDMEVRLMPIAAALRNNPHRFMTMKAGAKKNASKPTILDSWPPGDAPEALWKFLLQGDNMTVLIATKQGKFQKDGNFLSMDGVEPIQVQPTNALEATWRLVPRPRSRTALQHISSGRYLSYDAKAEAFTTCEGKKCAVDSAEFEIYPRIVGLPEFEWAESDLPPFAPKAPDNKAPWYINNKPEKVPEGQKRVPWYLRRNKK